MADSADSLVDQYLTRLADELADVPRTRREELVEEISEHIAAARAELPDDSVADVRSLLDRIGDPAVIAEEARERRVSEPLRGQSAAAVATLVLLLVGGIVIPFVGWIVGVVLLWVSSLWSTREKLIGTLVVPGGLLPAAYLFLASFSVESCSSEIDPRTQAVVGETCTGGTSTAGQVLGIALFVVVLVAPFATTVYLSRRLRRGAVPATA
jgi:uncharacterized membrane protein